MLRKISAALLIMAGLLTPAAVKEYREKMDQVVAYTGEVYLTDETVQAVNDGMVLAGFPADDYGEQYNDIMRRYVYGKE